MVALAYSGLGVVAVVPALILCIGPRRAPLPILLVSAGLVAGTLGDCIYTWLEARGSYASGHPVDLLWMVDYALCAAAAVIAVRTPRRPPGPPAERDAGLVLLLAGVAALAAYWLLEDRSLWAGAVLACVLAAMAVRLLLTARDHRRVTRELEAALADHERASVTDSLTGLRNRAAVEDALRANPSPPAPLGVVTLELATAALSFAARDEVVLAAASRIRALVGPGAVLGRTGTSEFALLVGNPAAARATAECLRAAVAAEPFPAGAVGACAGVAWAPDHGTSGEQLLGAAEQARVLARELGGNQVRVHGDAVDRALLEAMADEVDLRHGCEGHGRAAAAPPARRARRPRPARGSPPGDGPTHARRRAHARQRRPGDRPPPRHAGRGPAARGPHRRRLQRLGDPPRGARGTRPARRRGDAGAAAGALGHRLRPGRGARVPPARALRRRRTPRGVRPAAGVREIFAALRALGVAIAIDDFGTGFSSLATLADLPVDVLKLDRSFIHAMDDSPGHEALVGGVVSLAERLGLPIVAEGVETAEQFEALRALGCRWAQGYHLGRPAPLSALSLVDARTRSLR